MNTKTIGLKPPTEVVDSYRYIKTFEGSVSGVNVLHELIDNSIQYNSTEVTTIIDTHAKRIIHYDNGKGITTEIFCDCYHTIHREPHDLTNISSFGVGSKIFPKLSPVRITLTRNNDGCFYSVWSVASKEEFHNPVIDFLIDGEEIPEVLSGHDDIVKNFLKDGSIGTCTILPNIEKWGKYKSSKNFFNAVQKSSQQRYQLFLNENNQVDIALGFVDKDDNREWLKIKKEDLFLALDYSSAYDSTGCVEVRTWTVENDRRLKQGINVYRNNVRITALGFLKKGSRKPVVEVHGNDHKNIRQAVFFKSESDNLFTINPFKTQVELSCEIEEICASEFSKKVSEWETEKRLERQTTLTTPVVLEKTETDFSVATLKSGIAWKVKDNQITLNETSEVYNVLESASEGAMKLFKATLAEVLAMGFTPQKINKLGHSLEQSFNNKEV